MSQPATIRLGNLIRRILVYGGYGLGVLILVALSVIWYRGKVQEARVGALLAACEFVSIQGQYTPYQYEPPPGLKGPSKPGMLSLILRGGQRIHGFGVAGDVPPYLEPLIPVFGEHGFARVTDIAIHGDRFSDADIDLLLAFPDLRAVDLSQTAITDEGFHRLVSRAKLVELDVSGTKVSAASMRQLANRPELRELGLSDSSQEAGLESELQRTLPECWIR